MIILFLYHLAKRKKAKRGYNQVDLFFLEWAHSLWEIDRKNFKWLDCIYKFDTSRDMWGLTNKERHQNIDDAFVICADYKDIDFTNKNILIVDDIYTTGATIEAVAKVLQSIKRYALMPLRWLVVVSNLYY